MTTIDAHRDALGHLEGLQQALKVIYADGQRNPELDSQLFCLAISLHARLHTLERSALTVWTERCKG